MPKPSRAPMPWTTMCSGRVAVTFGSFCRSDPAAALRGLAKGLSPASTSRALSPSKASIGKKTSPRISTSAGMSSPLRRRGISAIVRTLGVVSAPAHVLGHALGPGGELPVGEGVVQGKQAFTVFDGGELRGVGARDLLGRGVRCAQLGVFVLDGLQR